MTENPKISCACNTLMFVYYIDKGDYYECPSCKATITKMASMEPSEKEAMEKRFAQLVAVARAAKALSDWDGHRPDGMDSDDYHVELFKRQDAVEAALSALDPDVIGGGE